MQCRHCENNNHSVNDLKTRADLGRAFAVSINYEIICNISPEQSSILATSALTFVFLLTSCVWYQLISSIFLILSFVKNLRCCWKKCCTSNDATGYWASRATKWPDFSATFTVKRSITVCIWICKWILSSDSFCYAATRFVHRMTLPDIKRHAPQTDGITMII